MNKCLRISFMLVGLPEKNAQTQEQIEKELQKEAQRLLLEGVVQKVEAERRIKLIACGSVERVEQFLDLIHRRIAEKEYEHFEIEPFFKECDYRGVFRIIE